MPERVVCEEKAGNGAINQFASAIAGASQQEVNNRGRQVLSASARHFCMCLLLPSSYSWAILPVCAISGALIPFPSTAAASFGRICIKSGEWYT